MSGLDMHSLILRRKSTRLICATCYSLILLMVVGACLHANRALALEPLNDTEMGIVTGQEGILISLDYYYNSRGPYKDDGSLRTQGNGADDLGAANTDCSGLGSLNCRLALQLENRGFGWLVFKNGHASLEMNRLSLDASLLGGLNGVSTENKAIAFNDGKFENEGGGCLLGTVNCTKAYIDSMPAVRARYPQTGGIYAADSSPDLGSAGGTIAGYNDVKLGVYVEGLAIEYNTPNAGSYIQDAWQKDEYGSFMGFNIADNAGHQAGIAIGGNFYMYGF